MARAPGTRPVASKGFATLADVTDYFRSKALRPAFSWQDVWGEEHAQAFTVAKAVETELLTDFRETLDAAIAESWSPERWKNTMRERLVKNGWGKPRLVKDPTGKLPARTVDFTSSRRLDTIFWANMRSARAAGQWERMQRTKARLPYLLYVRTASGDPRPEHLSWVGTILPIDDPFWSTHFPPNGWGCKCSVRQISARERDRLLGHRTDVRGSGPQDRRETQGHDPLQRDAPGGTDAPLHQQPHGRDRHRARGHRSPAGTPTRDWRGPTRWPGGSSRSC